MQVLDQIGWQAARLQLCDGLLLGEVRGVASGLHVQRHYPCQDGTESPHVLDGHDHEKVLHAVGVASKGDPRPLIAIVMPQLLGCGNGRVLHAPCDLVGLKRLATHLHPGGVFGLWSNELPDKSFTARLIAVFAEARAERVTFHNPLQNREFTQTV